jgi:hypothetical protein
VSDYDAMLKAAALEPPSVDSAAWSALQDRLEEWRDVRWVAVSFVRRTCWAGRRISDGVGVLVWSVFFRGDPHVSTATLPPWWVNRMRGTSAVRKAEAYGILLDGFALAHSFGEVPAAFLSAHGAPCPPGPTGKWVVTFPGGDIEAHEEAIVVAENLLRAGDAGAVVVPDRVTVQFEACGGGSEAAVWEERPRTRAMGILGRANRGPTGE